MSGRERQAPDIGAQSLEAQGEDPRGHRLGDSLAGLDSRVLPSTARPLPPRTEGEWCGAAGQLGGRTRERCQGRKWVTIQWARLGGHCLGDPANYKVSPRRIQFSVFADRFID